MRIKKNSTGLPDTEVDGSSYMPAITNQGEVPMCNNNRKHKEARNHSQKSSVNHLEKSHKSAFEGMKEDLNKQMGHVHG